MPIGVLLSPPATACVQGFKDIAQLRTIFEELGEVNECHLPRNKATGNSKGFAFVEFKHSSHADL